MRKSDSFPFFALSVCVGLQLAACNGNSYPEVRQHHIGESGATALEKLRLANFRYRIAWDGSLLLGEAQEKDCDDLNDRAGQAVQCQYIRLNFTSSLEKSASENEAWGPQLYHVQYFQRPETPIAHVAWMREIRAHFGELQEVKLHQNSVQNLESRRYVRVLSGPYQPSEMDILKEHALAQKEMATGCSRAVGMVRIAENRRENSTLSYEVEVMDIQRLCTRLAAIEKNSAKQGGSTNQLKFNL